MTKCIVESYKHEGIKKKKNRKVLVTLLKCFLQFQSAYITQPCKWNEFTIVFTKCPMICMQSYWQHTV